MFLNIKIKKTSQFYLNIYMGYLRSKHIVDLCFSRASPLDDEIHFSFIK